MQLSKAYCSNSVCEMSLPALPSHIIRVRRRVRTNISLPATLECQRSVLIAVTQTLSFQAGELGWFYIILFYFFAAPQPTAYNFPRTRPLLGFFPPDFNWGALI